MGSHLSTSSSLAWTQPVPCNRLQVTASSVSAATRPPRACHRLKDTCGALVTASSCAVGVAHARRRQAKVVGRAQSTATVVRQASEASDGSRIVAVVGRDGAGKSKLCAALLDVDAEASRDGYGTYADKMRLLEIEPSEAKRNFSCYNHVYTQPRSDRGLGPRLHLIDTPGHVERMQLTEHALQIAHGAVLVCSVKDNIDNICGRVLTALKDSEKPYAVFLNGLDMADDMDSFDASLEALELRLGQRPLVLYAPLHTSKGPMLLDVLAGTVCSEFECLLVEEGMGTDLADCDLPSDLTTWASELRDRTLEALAAEDDDLMEAYLSDANVSTQELHAALRRAAHAGRVVPFVVGSAKTGLGVDALQDVAQNLLPVGDGNSILKQLGVVPLGSVDFSKDGPFIASVVDQRSYGSKRLMELRVLSGVLRPMQSLKAVGTSVVFSPAKLATHGLQGSLQKTDIAGPGDLVLLEVPEGLDEISNGLCVMDLKMPCNSEAVSPEIKQAPVEDSCVFAVHMESLEPNARDKLAKALETIRLEGQEGFTLVTSDMGEKLLSCRGMLSVELLTERLATEFKVLTLPLGPPHVPYRCTVATNAVATGKHETAGKMKIRKGMAHKQGVHEDGMVRIEVEPLERGAGVKFEHVLPTGDATHGGNVAKNAVAGLERGIRQGLMSAGRGGVPVMDIHVRLTDAAAESEDAAVGAAINAVQKAVEKARAVLLEPIATLAVDVPEGDADKVAADLQARRGDVLDRHPSSGGESQVVDAQVPLRELREYPSALQRLTGGEGVYKYHVEEYREVLPQSVEKEILESELK